MAAALLASVSCRARAPATAASRSIRRRVDRRGRERAGTTARRAAGDDDDDIDARIPDDIPDALKDLVLNDDGDLVDTKTGQVLNDLGATRFDVAVRAMRGEYDPPGASTEKDGGQIFDTLTQFPTSYTFQYSGKASSLSEEDIDDIVKNIIGKTCECEVGDDAVEVKNRGSSRKFVSVWVTCVVHSAEMVTEVLTKLGEDDRVMFKL
ncbi:uncharacterized protein MICPUCDRAFT_48852 [Micromonas pusilla CCMP1545]|uniref:Predicted protein n=1 Tax=Micromonas pusilla (strain CCMP1545) TaxID=564608 RepID=C1N663_MICPC|nr:uncharacterized protein MICPUCDRAFT_48852 [Micromonas pusilla CCMP1545]EEH52616.1 predicted protein [Micromonas pusilla CCMP1545]|eukprot:XP_003063480.1 predicted protein [Micromonas pusilla CCMP1545]